MGKKIWKSRISMLQFGWKPGLFAVYRIFQLKGGGK